MKIYTRGGDDGTTGLFGGRRLPKHAPRLDAYGTVDELSATLGLCAAADRGPVGGLLQNIQNELFTLGSELARETPGGPTVQQAWIDRLEREIDAAEERLTPLRTFILPGGSELAARLHLARTVARRAERAVSSLAASAPVDPAIVPYLNRLSDWLFVQARAANRDAGVTDVTWVK